MTSNIPSTSNNSLPFVCINCHHPSRTLYQKYSDSGIRLTDCENCRQVVDKYIESDLMLIIIDLMLQYMAAYRHLLINTTIGNYTRLGTVFIICDAYKKWIEQRAKLGDSEHFYDLEWSFYECLLRSTIEIAVFMTVCLLLSIPSEHGRSIRFILSSTVCGFYGNVFVVLNIIWHLHQAWSYNALTQLFLFVSHVQVQRTIVPTYSLLKNVAIISLATAIQISLGNVMEKWIFNG